MNKSSQDFFKNENDRNDFYISIPVIAIAAVFILWQWGKSDLSILDNTPTDNIATTIEAMPSSEIKTNPKASKELIEEKNLSEISRTKPNSNPISTKEIQANSSIIPAIVPDIAEKEVIQLNSKSAISEATTAQSNVVEEKVSPSDNKEYKETNSAINETIQNAESNVIADNTSLECSIAVGLYREDANLNGMFNKLIQSGYAAIKEPLIRSTKVAIKIPCNKTTSLRILQEIRDNFASDAFIE